MRFHSYCYFSKHYFSIYIRCFGLKAYQICDKGTGYHISIDCSRLHNGEYILYINVGGNIESEKISIRQ